MIIKKNTKLRSTFVLLLLVITLIPFKIDLGTAGPPATGDWIIDTAETIQNQVIKMNGSIVITDTGSLTLENSEIIFMGGDLSVANGELNLTVQSNGTLVIYNSKITTDNANYFSYLISEEDALIHLEDSTFSQLGYDTSHGSLYILSDDAYIENCTIEVPKNSVAGLYFLDVNLAQVTDCNITSDTTNSNHGIGIKIVNSQFVKVTNCFIEIKGTEGYGIELYSASNCTIQQNTIISNAGGAWATGILVQQDSAFDVIKGNTILCYSSNVAGIVLSLSGSPGDVTGISIIENNVTLPTSISSGIYCYLFLSFNKFNEITINKNYIYVPQGTGIAGAALNEFDISHNTITAEEVGIGIIPISNRNITIAYNELSITEGAATVIQPANIVPEGQIIIAHNNVTKAKDAGFQIENTANVEITSNTISNLVEGNSILLNSVANVSVSSNIITNVPDTAISINTGDNIQVNSNLINQVNVSFGDKDAISIVDCNNTVIDSNTISYVGGNAITCDCSDVVTPYGYNLTITKNTIDNARENGIYIKAYFNVEVTNNNLDTLLVNGITICNVTQLNVANNTVVNANNGIFLNRVSDATVSGCTVSEVHAIGILVSDFQDDMIISQNTVLESGGGINIGSLSTVTGGIIEKNSISHCDVGVYVWNYADESLVRYNFLYDNYEGMYINSHDGKYYNNTLLMNYYGVYLSFDANNNLFYYNDFIENIVDAISNALIENNKFSEYIPVPETYLGNYWSKYTGVDEVEPFGIGDTPYDIGDGLIDEYPLMHGSAKIPSPSISHPADMVVLENTTGYAITWIVSSIFEELTYSINFNGTIIASGTLNDTAVVFDIPKLSAGNYTVTITITDPLGQNITDTVLIQVLPAEAGEEDETAGNFLQQLDWTSVGVGAGAGILLTIIGVIAVNALHKPKSKKKASTKRKGSKKKASTKRKGSKKKK
ncbi:MAG: right-handed parallel beta-helix repeat-containing protein [Candidatus Heimdallarchaeaceae archaeon]